MNRLTQRDEYGNADIIALSDVMPEIYAGLSFSETNALTEVLNRLAEYEETGLTPEQVKKLYDAVRIEIKPWNGWISTSERLPGKFENVLLSTNGGLVEEGFYFETTEFHTIWKGFVTHGTYWDDEITAWQSLPNPYHAESEE